VGRCVREVEGDTTTEPGVTLPACPPLFPPTVEQQSCYSLSTFGGQRVQQVESWKAGKKCVQAGTGCKALAQCGPDGNEN
jgi:hypothetical protein